MDGPADITALLRAADQGTPGAHDRLVECVYEDLSRLADKHLRQQFSTNLAGVTLEPAALVHESYLRLIEQRAQIANREHFFALATRVMLRVLSDYQRRRKADKRGGGARGMTIALEEQPASSGTTGGGLDVEVLARALAQLEELDPRKAQVVQLKIFWDRGIEQIATILGVSRATVERDWAFAKAWLAREAGGR